MRLFDRQIIREEFNKKFPFDRRKKYTRVLCSYTGEDGHEYRKGFYLNRDKSIDEMIKLIPEAGENKDISLLAKNPIM